MEIANHPNPKSALIAFVLVYKDLTITYNRFGQRLGSYRESEDAPQKYACTFFDQTNVYIALKTEFTLVLTPEMKRENLLSGNSTEQFYEDPSISLADMQSEFNIQYHFNPLIQPYFKMLEGLTYLGAAESLIAKYHTGFFLDLYALFKIVGLSSWKRELPLKILERVRKEMIRDLHRFPEKSEFPTVNDIIWDELNKLPIIQKLQGLTHLGE